MPRPGLLARTSHRALWIGALTPYLAFFISGASSLIFQLIWSRLLHHVFGSSSVAISSVVSVFMGGLALGAWIFGRYADRVRRPLLLYACAEFGVGLCALAVPWLVDSEGWLASINAALRQHFGSESLAFMVGRFVCIVPVLIVPTTLMGSSLPLLSRHFISGSLNASGVSVRVGALYAVNTLGAVLGVFLAGFVLMPKIGVSATNLVAVAMNFGLALAILLLQRRTNDRERTPDVPAGGSEAVLAVDSQPFPVRLRRAAAWSFALSGFCALLYEVVWSRALVNTIGGSVYAFALILMTFLVGIAGGSATASTFLVGGSAMSSGIIAAATAMCLIAPLPVLLRSGLPTWALASAALILMVLLIGRAARRRSARVDGLRESLHESLHEPLAPDPTQSRVDLGALVVPLLASFSMAMLVNGRLEWLLFSSLGCFSLLTAMLCLLHARLPLLLAGLQLFIALATFVSDVWADEISLAYASMVVPLYQDLGLHVDRVMALMFLTAGLCVLPAALGMGAMFPVTMRIWSAGGARVGRDVSVVYTGNTLGSIAGAWLPGFVLMPMLGMQATIHIGIAANIALALVVLRAGSGGPADGTLRRVFTRVALLAVFGLGIATFYPTGLTWNLTKMTLGVFRIALAKTVLDEETWGEPDLLYYKDGLSTTVSVERWGRHHTLKNNGKVEASNGDDMATQIMVAALPVLLHPRGARGLDTAIIGFGSGVTVGAALQFPVRSVDVIELERSVVEASRFFADVNHLHFTLPDYPYVSTPRLSVINDDGRNYLASINKSFDVIIGEPSNPWLTGVADLFTVDHFRAAKRRLRPGGVYCEWVQLYEISPENVKSIYRSFASQFKHVIVFSADDLSSDTVLVGSDTPLTLDLARMQRVFREPGVRAELQRATIRSPFDVLARVLFANKDEVLEYARIESRLRSGRFVSEPGSTNRAPCPAASCRRVPAPLNTDDNALIEFAAPRDLIGFERYKGYLQTIYAQDWPYGSLGSNVSGFGRGDSGAENYAELSMALLAHGRKRGAAAVLALADATGASRTTAIARATLEALGSSPVEPSLSLQAPLLDDAISDRANQRIRDAYMEVMDWLARGDPARARTAIEALPTSLLRYAGAPLHYLRGYVLYRSGAHDLALGELEGVVRADPAFVLAHPELFFFLGRAHDRLLHWGPAVRMIRTYVENVVLRPSPTDTLPEPSRDVASASDAPGESIKVRAAPLTNSLDN